MALGTLALAGLAAGGTALSGLPDIIPSKYEREQAKELAKLKRKQEMDALGLSDEERSALEAQLTGRADQSERFAQAERERLLTAGGGYGGQALQAEMLAADQARAQQAQLSAQIASADLAKQQEQEQYIRDLEAAQGEYKKKRQEALVAPLTAGMETAIGLETFSKLKDLGFTPSEIAAMEEKEAVPASVASDAKIAATMKQYNLKRDEAKALLDEFSDIDDMYNKYMGL